MSNYLYESPAGLILTKEVEELQCFRDIECEIIGLEILSKHKGRLCMNYHTVYRYFYEHFLISDLTEDDDIVLTLHGIQLQKLPDNAHIFQVDNIRFDFPCKMYNNIPASVIDKLTKKR